MARDNSVDGGVTAPNFAQPSISNMATDFRPVVISTLTISKDALESLCFELNIRRIEYQLVPGGIVVSEEVWILVQRLMAESSPQNESSSRRLRRLGASGSSTYRLLRFRLSSLSASLRKWLLKVRLSRAGKGLLLVSSFAFVIYLLLRSLSDESPPFEAKLTSCYVTDNGRKQAAYCDVHAFNHTDRPEKISVIFEGRDSLGFEVGENVDFVEMVVPANGDAIENNVFLGVFVTNGTYAAEPPYDFRITDIQVFDVRDGS